MRTTIRRIIRFRWLVLSCLLTCLAAIAAHPTGARAAQGNQGLQGGWAVDNSGNISFTHSLSSQYDFMQQAGAGWVRVNFRLGSCFPDWTAVGCNGMTALQTYDQIVANAASHNLKVLGLLSNESWHGGQSEWTADNAENTDGNGDNPYIDTFAANAAGVLAAHFNQDSSTPITQWEVWNEPNAWTSNPAPGVYVGGTFMYPSNFAWLLTQSFAAIKAVNPAALVISGGLFSHDRDTGADYLDSTYSMGIGVVGWMDSQYPFDAIGQHLYLDQGGATSTDHLMSVLDAVRATYLSYEGESTGKQTIVTEVGWTTTAVSADTQADNLQIAYTTFQNAGYVGQAYWFSVQDVPEARLYYGLVDSGGMSKAAFARYQQFATY